MPKYILDCDTGVDDALAIGILTALVDEGDILAITTTYGMAPLEYVTRNTKYVLQLLNKENIPVYHGSLNPLARVREYSGNFHGMDGLGNTLGEQGIEALDDVDAVDKIYQLINENLGNVKIISTGPLTNIARLLQKYPDISEKILDLTIMGGAFIAEGNVGKFAEANIYVDPEAASVVFANPVNKVVVPLDVTRKTLLSGETIEKWQKSASSAGQEFGKFVDFYFNAYKKYHPYLKGCALHDPLAVTLAIRPDLITEQHAMNVKVDLDESAFARTVEDLESEKEKDASIVLDVKIKVFEQLFVDSLPF